VSSGSKLRSAVVLLDGHRIKRTTKARFSVRVHAGKLKPGMHVLRIVATDSGSRKTTLRRLFRRCRVVTAPAFTG
jgi:hypothetical protein